MEVTEDKRRVITNTVKHKDRTFLISITRWDDSDTIKVYTTNSALGGSNDINSDLNEMEFSAMLDTMIKAKEEFGL